MRHARFDGLTASQRLLICRVMKAVRRLLPVSVSLVPPWDQAMVLEGLNAVFLQASAKSVNDIHALLVHPTRNST